MDYRSYRFHKKEIVIYLGIFSLLDAIVSILFYRSWISFLLLFSGIFLFLWDRRSVLKEKRCRELNDQFLTGMQAVSAALSAGYSVENTFAEALKEIHKIYGEEEMIIKEFTWIVNQLSLNQPLETLLLDLARRSEIEDIQSFAQVFAVSKRSGGDLIAIIRNTILAISQKEETKREIEVCIASKRLEQNVMSGIPLFILLYVGVASPGFLDGMYHNLTGIAIMTGCLILYFLAFVLGRYIVHIEV